MELYIGLMSGTSADGIDAALVNFSHEQIRLIATHYTPYTDELRERVLSLCQRGDNEIQRLGELDHLLGKAFANAVNELLVKQSLSAADICAIGSHGQTIRHHPHHLHPFTLQIADPNTIAALTGITTVADFRRKDVAHGGQGAPLVPAFHQAVFKSDTLNRAIVNIGGIANATILTSKDTNISGFDTGPGNTLMDAWIGKHHSQRHDEDGTWASTGKINQPLLTSLLSDAYFSLPAPKSTGPEYFNLAWLQRYLDQFPAITPTDVQTTLAELTAQSICAAVRMHFNNGEIIVCGGGVQNGYLITRLRELAQPELSVRSTSELGMDPAWIEAVAFAWLARETLNKRTGNLPSVTGAKTAAILGGVYFA